MEFLDEMCSMISENFNFLNYIFYDVKSSIITGLHVVQIHLTAKNFLYKEKRNEELAAYVNLILKGYFNIVQLGFYNEADKKLQLHVS